MLSDEERGALFRSLDGHVHRFSVVGNRLQAAVERIASDAARAARDEAEFACFGIHGNYETQMEAEKWAAARAAERALVERVEANSERPEPEAMSNAEGEAWDLLHDDSNIICTCDGCNFYSPTYDDRAECSLNIYIEDIVLARVRFATRAALRPEAATTERHWDECLHGVTLGSVCLDCPSKWASIPARPAATTEGAACGARACTGCRICGVPSLGFPPAAAVHPDTEGAETCPDCEAAIARAARGEGEPT